MEVWLKQFARTLPFRVHATDDFRHGAYRKRRHVAHSIAEIAPDSPGWLTMQHFDIDSKGREAARIVNIHNGHSHLIDLRGAWVRIDSDDPSWIKAIRYVAGIERAYTAALGADPGYAGHFQSNRFRTPASRKLAAKRRTYSMNWRGMSGRWKKKSSPTRISRNVEIICGLGADR
jgi:hypothetical protein